MKRDRLRTRHGTLASRSNRSSLRAQPSPRHHQCRSSSHTRDPQPLPYCSLLLRRGGTLPHILTTRGARTQARSWYAAPVSWDGWSVDEQADGVGGPATAGMTCGPLSRPGNGGSTGGLVGNSCRSRGLSHEPVPIAYPIDAWRLNRPPTGLAPGPGGRQRGASGREVRTATTTSWIALLATAAPASSSRSEAWVAFACRWRLLVDSVAMRSCFDCH